MVTIMLIIIAVVAAIYLYATLAFYYGFKNWYPLCGTKSSQCRRGESCSESLTKKTS
jgi:hypothetical protein